MFLGWKELNIGEDGLPTQDFTGWVASCFILFTYIIYVGGVREKAREND